VEEEEGGGGGGRGGLFGYNYDKHRNQVSYFIVHFKLKLCFSVSFN
jgi:hypothetical protein